MSIELPCSISIDMNVKMKLTRLNLEKTNVIRNECQPVSPQAIHYFMSLEKALNSFNAQHKGTTPG